MNKEQDKPLEFTNVKVVENEAIDFYEHALVLQVKGGLFDGVRISYGDKIHSVALPDRKRGLHTQMLCLNYNLNSVFTEGSLATLVAKDCGVESYTNASNHYMSTAIGPIQRLIEMGYADVIKSDAFKEQYCKQLTDSISDFNKGYREDKLECMADLQTAVNFVNKYGKTSDKEQNPRTKN